MKLIVGLGNPGLKYEMTRHNIGFVVIDFVAEYLKAGFKAGKGEFYFSQTKYKGDDLFLLKPSTYMNNSGVAVTEFLELHPEIKHENLLVVYDDFQLKLGTIRIRENGSDGGHNGISSVIYNLNTANIPRMRIGIGGDEIMKKDEYVNFVLSDFNESEIKVINKLLPVYKDCILSFISDPLKSVMNKYNRSFLEEEKPKQAPNIKDNENTDVIENS